MPAVDYRFGELMLIKPVLAAIGRRHMRDAVRSGIAATGAAAAAPGLAEPAVQGSTAQ